MDQNSTGVDSRAQQQLPVRVGAVRGEAGVPVAGDQHCTAPAAGAVGAGGVADVDACCATQTTHAQHHQGK